MEAKGVAADNGVSATVLRKEVALLRRGAAKVRDDVQESGMRRTHRDEPAHQGKILYPF